MEDSNSFETKLAIREVLDKYCDGVNQRDSEIWGSTWSKNAIWELIPMTLATKMCWQTIFNSESAPIADLFSDLENLSEICSKKTTQYRSLSTAECACGKQCRASSAASDMNDL